MSFTSETGYLPIAIDAMMDIIMENVNTQFETTYTTATFSGTNYYKYFYALIQRLQENEVKTSEIFLRMQSYFSVTNEKIQRPNTTHPGIFDYFQSKGYFISTKPPEDADAGKVFICVDLEDNHARGMVTITNYANLVSGTDDVISVAGVDFTAQAGASTPGDETFRAATSNADTAIDLAKQINAHAGAGLLVEAQAIDNEVWIRAISGGTAGNSIALAYTDNDSNIGATLSDATLLGGRALNTGESDYDVTKLEVCTIIKDCVVAGIVSQGSEVESITLSNGQSFDFKFNLPDKIPTLLRLTLTQSENNEFTILSPDDTKALLLSNVTARYKLGKNFEPQRYFSVVDAPWCSEVLLEYSEDNGANYFSVVRETDYDEVLVLVNGLADIEIVEA